jgi:hypothetical protein
MNQVFVSARDRDVAINAGNVQTLILNLRKPFAHEQIVAATDCILRPQLK